MCFLQRDSFRSVSGDCGTGKDVCKYIKFLFASEIKSILATNLIDKNINLEALNEYLTFRFVPSPKTMFANIYKDRSLAPENLSRTLEDSGTVTSVLIPWNTCGAAQSNVLGVATFAYAPYCFFNIISPFMTVFFAYAGIKIAKLKKGEEDDV